MLLRGKALDSKQQPTDPPRKSPSENSGPEPVPNSPVDDFLKRLKYEMHWPKPSQEAIAAALQTIQRVALEADAEESLNSALSQSEGTSAPKICGLCGHHNRARNKFCGMCGGPMEEHQPQEHKPEEPAAPGVKSPVLKTPAQVKLKDMAQSNGQHHYHHHYHHHYFPAGSDLGQPGAPLSQRVPAAERTGSDRTGKDLGPMRTPLSGPTLSRAEAAVRKLTQDWTLACNNKQLDDLIEIYAADALVLRSNVPPVRGTAAIREFFFAALDSGLGDVEMEPLRVDIVGEVAYEAGRCKMLVPTAVGKRREERGKYLVVFARQATAEWKMIADCWSSDLSLKLGAESEVTKPAPPIANPKQGIPRKTP